MWWPMHARKIAALPFCSDTLSLCLHLRRKAACTLASLNASPSQDRLAKICAHLCVSWAKRGPTRPCDSKIARISLPSGDYMPSRVSPHCLSFSFSPCLTMTPFFMGCGLDLQASIEQCTATSIKVAG